MCAEYGLGSVLRRFVRGAVMAAVGHEEVHAVAAEAVVAAGTAFLAIGGIGPPLFEDTQGASPWLIARFFDGMVDEAAGNEL